MQKVDSRNKINNLDETEISPILRDYQDGLISNAIEKAIQLQKKYPDSALLMNVLATCFMALRDFGSAMAHYQNALIIKPNSAELHNNIGLCFKAQGNLESAIIHLKMAIQLVDNYAEANNNLGNVYNQKGEYDNALNSFYASIEMMPTFIEPLKSAAKIELERGQISSANGLIERIVQIDAKDIDGQILVAQYYEKVGKYSNAVKKYKSILSQDSSNPNALNNLANLMLKLGEWDDAGAYFDECIKVHPTFHVAYVNKGKLLIRQEKFNEALNLFRTANELNKNDCSTVRLIANTLFGLRKFSEAAQVFHELRHCEDIKASDYIAASASDYELENWESCILNLRKGYDLNPSDKLSKFIWEHVSHQIEQQHSLHRAPKNFVDYLNQENRDQKYLRLFMPPSQSLINRLLELKSEKLTEFVLDDPRYGHGEISRNFKLFDENINELNLFKDGIVKIIEAALGKRIFIEDSFFNVFAKGGGTKPHTHITPHDDWFDLKYRKFALTYYLDVGDQSGADPGHLQFHHPDSTILPNNGDIIIFSASHFHSSKYDGVKNRVMIGINFYIY